MQKDKKLTAHSELWKMIQYYNQLKMTVLVSTVENLDASNIFADPLLESFEQSIFDSG